jgi:hypothetical protein
MSFGRISEPASQRLEQSSWGVARYLFRQNLIQRRATIMRYKDFQSLEGTKEANSEMQKLLTLRSSKGRSLHS